MQQIEEKRDSIDLKIMLCAGLRKWKWMLIVGLFIAVLVGGYEFILGISLSKDDYANWDSVMKIRDKKIEYSSSIEKAELDNTTVEKKIDDQQEYLKKSIYINLNPYDIQCAEAEYYVSTDYKIMPGMNYQNTDYTDTVANSYVSILTNADILNSISLKYGMESRYLKELLQISVSNRILSISVIHDDVDKAQQILDDVISYLPSIGEEITDGITEHTLSLINKTSYSYIDLNLIDKQKEQTALLQSLNQTKTENNNVIDDATYNLRKLENDEEKINNSTANIFKKMVKYAVVGFLAGLFLVYCYGCFLYFISDKVYIGTEIANRFGLKIIEKITSGKNKTIIDKIICKAEDRIYKEPIQDNYRVIAENIMGMKEKPSKILLTGCIEAEKLDEICKNILPLLVDITVKANRDILNNPDAINDLADCNAIVLVEQCGKSRYSVIANEIRKAEWFDKKIMGCVVIE